MLSTALLSALVFGISASAAPMEIVARQTCASYIIITTRGTAEPQGPSIAFSSMNSKVTSAAPGGTLYNTVYPAGLGQDSSAGTTDIVNQVNSGLASNPSQCFVLEGYSQGAAATVNALPKLTGAAFDAVKAVVLTGDPFHKAGLACNVDEAGGDGTKNVSGIEEYQGTSIPDAWVSKTRDVCYKGDGICDQQDFSFTGNHLLYGSTDAIQTSGANFIVARL